ncbi:MAG: Ig-like domain-containing protein [Gemmatimonadota bacterium]
MISARGWKPGAVAAFMALGAGVACQSDPTDVVPVHVVVVTPATAVLFPAATFQLSATLQDADGNELQRRVKWTSDRPSVASVSAAGHVTAVSPGTAAIIATSEGVSGGASVTVLAPVAAIIVAPDAVTLIEGGTVQLKATLRDVAGAELQRPMLWTSDAPAVASVGANGLVTALSAGSAVVAVESEGRKATARITVEAAVVSVALDPPTPVTYLGLTLHLTASVRDGRGNMMIRGIVWASSSPGVATVDANGEVHALAVGTTTITATCGGIVGAANVTVLAPVSFMVLEPPNATILAGGTLRLVATAKDAAGQPVTRPISWTSGAPNVATVNAEGLVTGVAPGVVDIRAAAEGISAVAKITVQARVAAVVITPDAAAVPVGGTAQLSAIARDAAGSTLNRPVGWHSNDPARATVDANGRVTGIAAGTAAISATVDEVADTAIVTVLEPVARVSIATVADIIDVGTTVQLLAAPLDRNGQILSRPVQWASGDVSIATVNNTGLVTGVSPGTATITARSDGKSDATSIRVLVPVSSVLISASTTAIAVNQSLPFTAQPLDAQGKPVSRPVYWETSNPSIATVNQSGVVTGVAVGSVKISAVAGSKRGEVTITVQPGVASVLVTASNSMVTPEAPVVQVTAAVRDANGNPVQLPVTWSSSDLAVLTVTATGALTADVTLVAAGNATITATAGGISGSVSISAKGPPNAEEGVNNLSWPAIFADGFDLTGAPVGTSAGLRPLPDEGITVDSLPFWYHLNTPDYQNTYYLQGGDNVWRAEWLNGAAQNFGSDVKWGDNLTHHSYNTHAVIHVEVALFARNVPNMRGFNMTVLSGSGPDEIQGTNGSVGLFQPALFTVHPRLVIEKLDAQGGSPRFTVVDQKLADGFGEDGPGFYRAELNKAGKISYGYNFKVQGISVPSGETKYGWYRISFILEDQVLVGGVTVPRRVTLDALAASDDPEVPTYVPQLDPNRKRSYLDVFISSASGGH